MIHSLPVSFSQIRSDHIIPLPEIFHWHLIVLNNKNPKHQTREGGIVHVYLSNSLCIMFSYVPCVRTTTFFQLCKPARLPSCHRSFKHTHSSLYLAHYSFPPNHENLIHSLDFFLRESFFGGPLMRSGIFITHSNSIKYLSLVILQEETSWVMSSSL